MTNFKSFELSNSEMIFGGELINTVYSGRNGDVGRDLYDTIGDAVIYLEE